MSKFFSIIKTSLEQMGNNIKEELGVKDPWSMIPRSQDVLLAVAADHG